jgi:phosphoribosylglycinamide formyltransferase-1
MTKNLAIFASGNGSNAENICCFFKKSSDINVVLICSNNKNAYVVKIAKKLDIPLFLFTKKGLENFFKLKNILKKNRIDFIILAGFLLKIPKKLLKNYPNKVINIHPALLPKYGGKGMYGNNVHKAVLEKKETESGITIHFVNSKYDDGEIIFQTKCRVEKNDSIESLGRKIQKLERKFFPKIIEGVIKKTLKW